MPNIDPTRASKDSLISDKEMKKVSAYEEDVKPRSAAKSPKQNGKKDHSVSVIRRDLDKAKAEIDQLRKAESERREHTPGVFLGDDSIALEFTGKIAGKTALRRDPFVEDDNVMLLKPILQPIVSVMNAALRSRDLEAHIMQDPSTKKDATLDGDPVYRATSLTRATYAYEALLQNPAFIEQLKELNKVIEQTYTNLSITPAEVKTYTKAKPSKTDALRQKLDHINEYELLKPNKSSGPDLPGE